MNTNNNIIEKQKDKDFPGGNTIFYLNFCLLYAALIFLFPNFFVGIHNLLADNVGSNIFNLLNYLGLNVFYSSLGLMAIYSSIAVYARDFFVKKKENNIKSSFIRTFFNFSGVFLINYLFPSMTESVALAKSNFSQHILSVPMVSSAYFAFPTDNFSELLQLPILPKFCIFMTMNYSLIMNLYFLNKIVFSLNETKIFKSFQKEHLKNIAYYSFCHFLIFKPAGILLYRFWITGGVVQLDFMHDLQTKQAVGYYLLFAALYWPLSRILDAILNKGEVLENESSLTV